METRELASGLKFPEGPVALDDGDVLLVEIARGTLTRVGADGRLDVVANLGGGPNGAAIGPDGAVYITNNGGCFSWDEVMGLTIPGAVPPTWKGGSIQRVDLSTGAVSTLYTESSSGPLRAPNDLVFDGHGGFWFTDHGVRLDRSSDRTGIHYAKADGSSCEEVIFPLDAPNGIGLSPDGTRLYAAETHTGRVFWWGLSGPGEVERDNPVGNGGHLLAGGIHQRQRPQVRRAVHQPRGRHLQRGHGGDRAELAGGAQQLLLQVVEEGRDVAGDLVGQRLLAGEGVALLHLEEHGDQQRAYQQQRRRRGDKIRPAEPVGDAHPALRGRPHGHRPAMARVG